MDRASLAIFQSLSLTLGVLLSNQNMPEYPPLLGDNPSVLSL